MNSSSTAECRVSHCRRAANPALAGSSRRRLETTAVAVPRGAAASALARRLANVGTGVDGWVLKRKSGEGFLHPIIKKANTVDDSASEADEGEEYPHRFLDFDWERAKGDKAVMYELNFPRVRINSDDEHCRPINRRAPLNAEIERLVEELRLGIKRWVYYFPYDCCHREAVAS